MEFQQSLYRTFMPKVVNYSNDGTGRDCYISGYNGGLRKIQVKPDITERKGMFILRNRHSRASASPVATSLKYHSDGSGRDFYITQNSGGLQQAYLPGGKKDLFKSTLRASPERSTSDSFYSTTQSWLSNRSRIMVQTMRNTAQGVTERLYPKSEDIKEHRSRSNRFRQSY